MLWGRGARAILNLACVGQPALAPNQAACKRSAARRFEQCVLVLLISVLLPPDSAAAASAEPLPKVAAGRIERIDVHSRFVEQRPVDVWSADGCDAQHRCPVIYMQDGQMLFDAGLTWNHQTWQVDRALTQLAQQARAPPAIVVAIWNDGKYRWSEYFPQKILAYLDSPARSAFTRDLLQDEPRSDAYLKFVVKELKPYIDGHFATLPDRAHTFIAGSSMGAVIAVYALNEYPQVFGGAAGLSVHWAGRLTPNVEIPLATFEYLQARLAPPQGHRLYMDHGTVGLDAWYAPYQLFIDQIVAAHGYTPQNFQSRVFDGAGHDEASWAKRVAIPLEFLLSGVDER